MRSRPTWGVRDVTLGVLALLYPFHYYVQGAGEVTNVSLGDALIALVVIGFIVSSLGGRFSLPRYTKPVLAFVLVAFVSLLFPLVRPGSSPAYFSPGAGFVEIIKIMGSAAWMVAVFVLLRRKPFSGIRAFGVVSVVTASVFAVLTIQASLMQPGTRPSGPFENENLYANYLVLNLFLAAILAQLEGRSVVPRGLRVPTWVAIPILSVGILATGSRGALIGAVAASALLIRRRGPSRLSLKHAALFLLTLGLSGYGLVMFWQANPFIADRVSSVLTGEGPNITNRQALWRAAYEAFLTSPLLGIGYHQFPDYAETMDNLKPTVVHNTYLAFAAEVGLVGFGVLVWLLAAVIRDGVWISRKPGFEAAHVLVLCVVATLVQGLFADVEHYRSLWTAFGMLAALRQQATNGSE